MFATVNALTMGPKAAEEVKLRDWIASVRGVPRQICFVRHCCCFISEGSWSFQIRGRVNQITDAMAKLAANDFPTAASDYDFLSNICQHNGLRQDSQ
jgi:hypothetical protein